eukprot:1159639-Pelagomonas_calceolata.AAC.3
MMCWTGWGASGATSARDGSSGPGAGGAAQANQGEHKEKKSDSVSPSTSTAYLRKRAGQGQAVAHGAKLCREPRPQQKECKVSGYFHLLKWPHLWLRKLDA